MKIANIIALLFVTIYAQKKPVWPKQFSTSVTIHGWGGEEHRDHFFRWFYDQTQNKDRLSGPQRWLDEWYFSTSIFDHTAKKEWRVYYQEQLFTCFVGPLNTTLPVPNFDAATFIGKAEMDYLIVDHWIERSHDGRVVHQIYDRADNLTPVRLDRAEPMLGRAQTFKFHEWDLAPQDPDVFQLPAAVLANCNTVNNWNDVRLRRH